jgi:hypothetical protein|nr:MAG TPA_asm: hypothetical protein [Caudoviricetes sp.]
MEDIDVIPMEFCNSPRFNLQGVDCTKTMNLPGFHMEGSYALSGNSMMVIERTHSDYNELKNKPQIESVELKGNRTLDEFGLSKAANTDILSLFKEG